MSRKPIAYVSTLTYEHIKKYKPINSLKNIQKECEGDYVSN